MSIHRSPSAPFAARCGLTFIELMFATVILGVGMIMIASVFPVAINEQRAMVDESTISSIERGAVRTLDAAVTQYKPILKPWLPVTGANEVASFGDPAVLAADAAGGAVWNRIASDLVNKANPRYAWTAVYQRQTSGPATGNPIGHHDVTFFVTSLVTRSADAFKTSAADLDKLRPHAIQITYYYKGTPDSGLASDPEEDTILIEGVAADVAAACEGAILVRAKNVVPTSATFPQNAIIKLGSVFTDDELSATPTATEKRFRIQPGFALLKGDVGAVANQDAWLVGRDPTDTSSSASMALSCRAITVKVADPG